ncbi:MAG: hypothetical protein MUC69_01015 [Gemmatimonadales bacterium]|jgi:hypothetical protein|nr:hypothetical protein [Gemmatimonadales bacterium]
MRHNLAASLVLSLLLLAGGCSDSGDGSEPGPDEPGTEKPPAELNILRLAADAPPLESPSVSFWAVKGDDREGRIYFLNESGERGEEYARLKIDEDALRARPDGSLFAEGDSVLVTVTILDPAQILFQLAPEGLQFNPDEPAVLVLKYAEADDDFDGDGERDDDDDDIEQRLGIWRQATPSDPFVRLGSARFEDLEEIEAELTGFSRYAIAY